ncbi:RING-type E3 ubiquitin transferase [Salvia divinorum]|uniref:RING-type E3 ubiquitin transferase n=1 Tax=Salvia divinorum TaxID=28513 RepID=A0ABD1HIZ8_SALDI
MLATQISMFDLDAALTMAVDAPDKHEEREEENDESKAWRLLEQVPTVEGGGYCAVCSEGLRLGGAAKRIPCGHVFHQDCILRWLSLIYSCPLCRQNCPPPPGTTSSH